VVVLGTGLAAAHPPEHSPAVILQSFALGSRPQADASAHQSIGEVMGLLATGLPVLPEPPVAERPSDRARAIAHVPPTQKTPLPGCGREPGSSSL
jgi:hypothetical protein